MVAAKKYTNDEILAHFTRPGRTINSGRIPDIASKKIYGDIPPATDNQLRAFLDGVGTQEERARRFVEENPIHPASLTEVLRLISGKIDRVWTFENSNIEFKESLNFGNSHEYAKILAAFSNANGGYLIFGVKDDKTIIGIPDAKIQEFDPQRIGSVISGLFSPNPAWEPAQLKAGDKTLLVLYTKRAEYRPVVCRKSGQGLVEGDIYYRYPGQTTKIKAGELQEIINDRIRMDRARMDAIRRKIELVGIENIGILNLASGEVSGSGGRFVIDEKLIPKLRFINEGSFSETTGEPTLKLIGSLEPLAAVSANAVRHVFTKQHITDDELIEAFLFQRSVDAPKFYFLQSAHTQRKWLPIFFFMRMAGLTQAEAVSLLKSERGTVASHVKSLCERVSSCSIPKGPPSANSVGDLRARIIRGEIPSPTDEKAFLKLAKTLRTLGKTDVNEDVLMPKLQVYDQKFVDPKSQTEFRYALAHIDAIIHQKFLSKASK